MTSTPSAALVIVIIDQATTIGSLLGAEYARNNTLAAGRAVVTAEWVTSCIQHGEIIGPPTWGGHGLHRHTLQSWFGGRDSSAPDITTQVPLRDDYLAITTERECTPSPLVLIKECSPNLVPALLNPSSTSSLLERKHLPE